MKHSLKWSQFIRCAYQEKILHDFYRKIFKYTEKCWFKLTEVGKFRNVELDVILNLFYFRIFFSLRDIKTKENG